MEKGAKIYVAGHNGMVGSAIVRRLKSAGYTNIICRTHTELDLTRQSDVESFFAAESRSMFLSLPQKLAESAQTRLIPLNLRWKTHISDLILLQLLTITALKSCCI